MGSAASSSYTNNSGFLLLPLEIGNAHCTTNHLRIIPRATYSSLGNQSEQHIYLIGNECKSEGCETDLIGQRVLEAAKGTYKLASVHTKGFQILLCLQSNRLDFKAVSKEAKILRGIFYLSYIYIACTYIEHARRLFEIAEPPVIVSFMIVVLLHRRHKS
jgi:hypothetical protein